MHGLFHVIEMQPSLVNYWCRRGFGVTKSPEVVTKRQCRCVRVSTLGFSVRRRMVLTRGFPSRLNCARGQAWVCYKAKDEGRIIQPVSPFSFVSFHQQRAKRYQLYVWIHLVAFWGFCFSVVKFSSWVQSLSPVEVSSRTPTAPVRTGIGGTLENTPLFWSFCFSFKKLWIDRFIPSYYSNNDLYTKKK